MNFKKLASDLGLEEEDYVELIELFVDVGMSDFNRLQSALEEGDAEKAAKAAHSIKGAAGNLGLTDIYETAKLIVEEARGDRLDGTGKTVQSLKKRLDFVATVVNGREKT